MRTSSTAEMYLTDFHNRCPGVTSHAFGDVPAFCDSRQYDSSYACLTELVAEGRQQTVLDLGCGDGYLLSLLATCPELDLIGVDISMAELMSARHRLGDVATLCNARAQALPVESDSVDLVLSHMALMLMDDVPQVIAESARVLKTGGVFSAIVGRRFLLGPVHDTFLRLMEDRTRADGIQPIGFGGGMLRTPDGIATLFAASFTSLSIQEIDVPFNVSAQQLWQMLCATYSMDRFSVKGKTEFRDLFLKETSSLLNNDGLIETGWGLRQITATRSQT
jgi:SAM-dependent methyltransferase